MSDYPPPPPPYDPYPAPPPAWGALPPAGGEGPRLPWEERSRLGFGPALIETAKLLVTAPDEAFRRLRADGDLVSPFLFGLLTSWVGVLVGVLWNVLFQGAMLGIGGAGRELPIEALGGPVLVLGVFVVAWPIFFAITVFIGAAIYHLALMVVGALAQSPTRFEGTLKVVCYSAIAQVAGIVPFIGGLIGAVLGLVLMVIGFAAVHRTTPGRSVAAVAVILAVCCLCVVVIMLAFGAAIAAAMAGAGGG